MKLKISNKLNILNRHDSFTFWISKGQLSIKFWRFFLKNFSLKLIFVKLLFPTKKCLQKSSLYNFLCFQEQPRKTLTRVAWNTHFVSQFQVLVSLHKSIIGTLTGSCYEAFSSIHGFVRQKECLGTCSPLTDYYGNALFWMWL